MCNTYQTGFEYIAACCQIPCFQVLSSHAHCLPGVQATLASHSVVGGDTPHPCAAYLQITGASASSRAEFVEYTCLLLISLGRLRIALLSGGLFVPCEWIQSYRPGSSVAAMADSATRADSGAPAQSTGQQNSQANPLEVCQGAVVQTTVTPDLLHDANRVVVA